MRTTLNVLSIESLSYTPRNDERTYWLEGELNFSVNFKCRDNGTTILRIRFKSYCRRSYSIEDAMKTCIENFFNKKIEDVSTERYGRNCDCMIDWQNIHHVDVQVQEPFKSLFNDLFDKQKWEIPSGLLQEEAIVK